jgi:hypothetical protein
MVGKITGNQLSSTIIISGSFSGSFVGDGSGLSGTGGGSTPTLQQVTDAGASTTNLIEGNITSASLAVTASHALFAVSASHEVIKEVSSSHANFADSAGGLSGIPSIVINQITASGNISASSATITALTGSFNHIITDDETIEFRNKNTGVQTGRLKFDASTGLNVQDNTGARTKIRAGRGEFLSLEAGPVGFNSLGSITASVNISASGDIVGNNLSGTNTGDQDLSNLVTNSSTASFAITGSDVIFGNITSSGNISASGDIIGDTVTTSGNIQAGARLLATGRIIGDVSVGAPEGTFTTITNVNTTHVTASGAISASGDILANNLSGTNTGDQDLSNLVTNAQTASFAITGSNVLFGNITSSGNISASGNINGQSLFGGVFGRIYPDSSQTSNNQFFTADANGINSNSSFSVTGNITSSANISASGDIIGDTIKTNTLQSPDTFLTFDTVLTGSQIRLVGGIANSGINLDNVSGKPILHGNDGFVNIGSLIDSTPINLLHNVTASANISASGDIVANKVTADVVDTSFETFLNFEAATAFTFIAPFAMTINFTGSSTSSMDVAGFVTASANTSTFSVQQTPPITLNIFDKLKITPSSSGLFSFSGSRTI